MNFPLSAWTSPTPPGRAWLGSDKSCPPSSSSREGKESSERCRKGKRAAFPFVCCKAPTPKSSWTLQKKGNWTLETPHPSKEPLQKMGIGPSKLASAFFLVPPETKHPKDAVPQKKHPCGKEKDRPKWISVFQGFRVVLVIGSWLGHRPYDQRPALMKTPLTGCFLDGSRMDI